MNSYNSLCDFKLKKKNKTLFYPYEGCMKDKQYKYTYKHNLAKQHCCTTWTLAWKYIEYLVAEGK